MKGILGIAVAAAVAAIETIAPATAGVLPTERPNPISYELMAELGNKAECLTITAVAAMDLRDQAEVGGRVVALTHGADQAFSNTWRLVSGAKRVQVKGVIAHGFGVEGSTVVIVTEFDTDGCAISRTPLSGATWDRILKGAFENDAKTVKDSI